MCGNKRFNSQASYENHVKSKKHKEAVAAGKEAAVAKAGAKRKPQPAAATSDTVHPRQAVLLEAAAQSTAQRQAREQEAALAAQLAASSVGGAAEPAAAPAAAADEAAPAGAEPPAADGADADVDYEVDERACLFCTETHDKFEDALAHMVSQNKTKKKKRRR